MKNLLRNDNRLRRFSFGCLSDMTDHCDVFLPLLCRYQKESLESLYLCSVKEDPTSYGLIQFPESSIADLTSLQHFGIDFDYLTNQLLMGFCARGRTSQLQRLVIHVHGVDPDREHVTNDTWRQVVNCNPDLRVTLNLMHSLDGAVSLLNILQPCMPLEKLRMFFCQKLNVAAIDFISQNLHKTFTTLSIVEGLDANQVSRALCFTLYKVL